MWFSSLLIMTVLSLFQGGGSYLTTAEVGKELVALKGHLRKLISSNCYIIERGTMPPYQKCEGCKIEDAIACITDMRTNASGNVAGNCEMNMIYNRAQDYDTPVIYDSKTQKYLTKTGTAAADPFVEDPRMVGDDPIIADPCCPIFEMHEWKPGVVLDSIPVLHQAYPETFECLVDSGCENSEYWVDLKRECDYLCPVEAIAQPSTGGSVCQVFYNAAPARFSRSATTTLLVVAATSLLALVV
jgi:hypothetical protein